MSMETVHVYDTWVIGQKGRIHFDVMTTDEAIALKLAREYLDRIGEAQAPVTLKECQFCHSEPLVLYSAGRQKEFKENGGFIVPLPA